MLNQSFGECGIIISTLESVEAFNTQSWESLENSLQLLQNYIKGENDSFNTFSYLSAKALILRCIEGVWDKKSLLLFDLILTFKNIIILNSIKYSTVLWYLGLYLYLKLFFSQTTIMATILNIFWTEISDLPLSFSKENDNVIYFLM